MVRHNLSHIIHAISFQGEMTFEQPSHSHTLLSLVVQILYISQRQMQVCFSNHPNAQNYDIISSPRHNNQSDKCQTIPSTGHSPKRFLLTTFIIHQHRKLRLENTQYYTTGHIHIYVILLTKILTTFRKPQQFLTESTPKLILQLPVYVV